MKRTQHWKKPKSRTRLRGKNGGKRGIVQWAKTQTWTMENVSQHLKWRSTLCHWGFTALVAIMKPQINPGVLNSLRAMINSVKLDSLEVSWPHLKLHMHRWSHFIVPTVIIMWHIFTTFQLKWRQRCSGKQEGNWNGRWNFFPSAIWHTKRDDKSETLKYAPHMKNAQQKHSQTVFFSRTERNLLRYGTCVRHYSAYTFYEIAFNLSIFRISFTQTISFICAFFKEDRSLNLISDQHL